MHKIGEDRVAHVDARRGQADEVTLACRIEARRARPNKDARVCRGQREHGEPRADPAGAGLSEPVDHKAASVVADSEGQVTGQVHGRGNRGPGIGDLDHGLTAAAGGERDRRRLAVAPEPTARSTRLHGQARRHLERHGRKVDHAAGQVGRVEPQPYIVGGDREAIDPDRTNGRGRGLDRHPDRAARRRHGDHRRQVCFVDRQAHPAGIAGGCLTASEDVLAERRERECGHLLGCASARGRIENLHRVELDPKINPILEHDVIAEVDIEVTAEAEQAPGARPQLVGQEREGEPIVGGDRRREIDRHEILGQPHVLERHVGCFEHDAVDAHGREPADIGVEQRPLPRREPTLGEHTEGEVYVLSNEACPSRIARDPHKARGLTDPNREGVDRGRCAVGQGESAERCLEGERAVERGKVEQIGVDRAAGGERRAPHVERDRAGRGGTAEQYGLERAGGGRPVHSPAAARVCSVRARVDHDRGSGGRGREGVDAGKARAARGRLGRHPEPLAVEIGSHGEAEHRVVKREAHVGDAEEQVRQGRSQRDHRGIHLAAVVERKTRVVGLDPHRHRLIDHIKNLQPGLALQGKQDLRADPEVEARIANACLDLVAEGEGRGEVGGIGGDQVGGEPEADVARDGNHVEERGGEALDVEGHGPAGDRLGEGVAGRADGERLTRGDTRARGACDQPEPPILDRQAAPLLGDTAGGDRIAHRHERVARDGEAEAARERHEAGDVGPEARHRESGRTCGQLGGEGVARGADGQPGGPWNRHEPGRAVLHDHAIGRDAGQAGDRGRKAALNFQGQSAAPAHQAQRAVGERDLARVGYDKRRRDPAAEADERAIAGRIAEGKADVARERDKVWQCGGEARQREGRGAGSDRLGERVRHAADVEPLARGDRPAARGRAKIDRLSGSRVESSDVEVEVGPADFEGRLANADRKAEGPVAEAHRRKFAAVERGGDSTPHGDKPRAVMAEAHATVERNQVGDRRRKALDREGDGVGGDRLGKRVGGGARVERAARGDRCGRRGVLGKDRGRRHAPEASNLGRERPLAKLERGFRAGGDEAEGGAADLEERLGVGRSEPRGDPGADHDNVRSLEADAHGAAYGKISFDVEGGGATRADDPALRGIGGEPDPGASRRRGLDREIRLAGRIVDKAAVGSGEVEGQARVCEAAGDARHARESCQAARALGRDPAAGRRPGGNLLGDERHAEIDVGDGHAHGGLRARSGAGKAAEILAAEREHVGGHLRAVGERHLLRAALEGKAAEGPEEAAGNDLARGHAHAEGIGRERAKRVGDRVEREHHARVVGRRRVSEHANLVGVEREVGAEPGRDPS